MRTASSGAIVVAVAGVLVATALVTAPLAVAGAAGCSPEERAGEFAGAQEQVLDLLGEGSAVDLTTVENEVDLAALAAIGYGFYDRQQVSVRGMGWPVVDVVYGQPPGPGRPSVLFYEPTGIAVTAPRDGFDFPYVLRGWAYAFPYTSPFNGGTHPDPLSCATADEWFVHEAGVHTFEDGDFDPVRPAGDDPRGAAADDPATDVDDTNPCPEFFCTGRQPGDWGHGRLWDLHLWRGDEVPTVSLMNPGPKLPGADPQIGKAFFHLESSD